MNLSKEEYMNLQALLKSTLQISNILLDATNKISQLLGNIAASDSKTNLEANSFELAQFALDHNASVLNNLNITEGINNIELDETADFISQKTITEADEMLKTYRKAYFRKKNNTWELRYRRCGIDKSFAAATQTECKNKFDIWLKENNPTVKKICFTSVNNWYEQWLTVYKKPKVSPASFKTIDYLLRKNMLRVIGEKDIKKISNIELQNLIYNMVARGNSRHKMKNYLQDIFKLALNNKIIKENVAIGLEENSLPYKEGIALDRKEQLALFQHPDETILKKYYIFTLLSGCRRDEALRFQPEDIVGERIHINGTKTQSSDRTIPLFPEIKRLFDTIEMIPGTTVFEFKSDYVTRNAKKYLPNGHTIKDLRTTFATNCNEQGVDTKVIQKWMGHTSDTMTKQRYIKILSEYEQSETEKMTNIFPNSSPIIE